MSWKSDSTGFSSATPASLDDDLTFSTSSLATVPSAESSDADGEGARAVETEPEADMLSALPTPGRPFM
eukprot:CAMPEP_0206439084 /NCGR_PEP_ID=MMETSP0324_2-20121206/12006_1 /ASSEMBLY_ACC=CAM_ASM_000836 /TAXON_ID=2866 /ORGANISM="Crypthecodinium cohnii, Strain Seligo" /LENGTH=68 /DNA_ID=CAMNT_0053906649 /DNA_START=720 /DNA_END=926 /DNA_ORIENTATION=-